MVQRDRGVGDVAAERRPRSPELHQRRDVHDRISIGERGRRPDGHLVERASYRARPQRRDGGGGAVRAGQRPNGVTPCYEVGDEASTDETRTAGDEHDLRHGWHVTQSGTMCQLT